MSEQYTPDNLLAGDAVEVVSEAVNIQASLDLKRGTVRGKVTADAGSAPSVVGTGDGTISTPAAQIDTQKGDYVVECKTAIVDGGVFSVTDPLGREMPDAYAGKYVGTGNGTLTLLKGGRGLKRNGLYSVKCIEAITNGGVFKVTDPDGVVLGIATILVGAGGVIVFAHDQLSFKLTDGVTDFVLNDEFLIAPYLTDQIGFDITIGSADFIVGDSFTITVVVGSKECKPVDSSLSDGSQSPYAILAEDVDTSLGAKQSVGYMTGEFNEDALIFGGVDDKDTHSVALRDLNIHLKKTTEFQAS